MIDTTKPWFPQDYTLDEVLSKVTHMPLMTLGEHEERLNQIREDYRIRKGGVAGVFNDLRVDIIEAVGKPDPNGGHIVLDYNKFKDMVTEEIAKTIAVLEGSSIPTTRFVLMEYAVPVFSRDTPPNYDCHTTLKEETRHATALGDSIMEKYWAMVNT